MAGKKRKSSEPKQKPQKERHLQALDSDDDTVVSKTRSRLPKQHHEEDKLISPGLSAKILSEALKQQREIIEEAEKTEEEKLQKLPPFSIDSVGPSVDSEDEDEIDDFHGFSEIQSQYDGYEQEINEEDERILAAFMSNDAGPQRTLADIIIQRIREKDTEAPADVRPLPKLDSSIIDLYKGVGKILSRYTSGKIPKALKHIPSLELWEEVLYLAEPEKWTPNAMFQATRLFAAKNAKKAQRFYNLVLLPRVREDIREHKRLHFALYQSLRKSLYKPAAFFKGILLPLCKLVQHYIELTNTKKADHVDEADCKPSFLIKKKTAFALFSLSTLLSYLYHLQPEFLGGIRDLASLSISGTCTLREAVIIGSIIQKCKIPPIHSSVALMKMAEMDYCGTTSYFIKLVLDKKYALPYRVLDAVLAHFMRFLEDERIMPVIWHQSLLSLVQRYKNELTEEDKGNLDRLLQHQKHHLVTAEIRRELKGSLNRGEKEDDAMSIASPFSVIRPKVEEDRWDIPEVPMEED